MKQTTRNKNLDLLRGTAVLFMLITHTHSFFYSETGTVLDFLTWWGATVCFTIFLFVSGSVVGIKITKNKTSTRKALKRSGLILVLYYLMAIFMYVYAQGNSFSLSSLFRIISFSIIPEFTEYMIPLVFFPLLQGGLARLCQATKRWVYILIMLSFFAFGLSWILYHIDWGGGYLNSIQSLLVGSGELHTFPLLNYLPIYVLGVAWGFRSHDANPLKEKRLIRNIAIIASTYVVLLISGLSEWNRWPPSLLLFCYGLAYIYACLYALIKVQTNVIVERLLGFFGRNALWMWAGHLVVLVFLQQCMPDSTSNPGTIILLDAFVIGFTSSSVYAIQYTRSRLRSFPDSHT